MASNPCFLTILFDFESDMHGAPEGVWHALNWTAGLKLLLLAGHACSIPSQGRGPYAPTPECLDVVVNQRLGGSVLSSPKALRSTNNLG
jgi:hypothetical protein